MSLGEYLETHKSALRWDIKRAMKSLCEKLAEIGEECFIVSANPVNGMVGHMGSIRGDEYINEKSNILYDFLEYCRECDESVREGKMEESEEEEEKVTSTDPDLDPPIMLTDPRTDPELVDTSNMKSMPQRIEEVSETRSVRGLFNKQVDSNPLQGTNGVSDISPVPSEVVGTSGTVPVLNQLADKISTDTHVVLHVVSQKDEDLPDTADDLQEEEEELGKDGLPVAVSRVDFAPVNLPAGEEPTLIMLDIEANELICGLQMPKLIQVSALELKSHSVFNKMCEINETLKPKETVGTSAGVFIRKQYGPLESVKVVMDQFIRWLNRFNNVILVAHNGRKFDYPVLINTFVKVDLLKYFFSSVSGVLDGLLVFKIKYPKLKSYKQEDLACKILDQQHYRNNSFDRVISLGLLIQHARITKDELLPLTITSTSLYHSRQYDIARATNISSLDPLVYMGIIKCSTADKIAGSGLGLHHLQTIFEQDGEEGLIRVFTSRSKEGVPRVSNAKRILEIGVPKIAEYFRKK